MKQGFQEIAPMLKSAPQGSKRYLLDSDSENSDSEIQAHLQRTKKHKPGMSEIDVDAAIDAILNENSDEKSHETKQKDVLDDILQEFELEESFAPPVIMQIWHRL